MDEKRYPGGSVMPQLVVKIVGGKQIKQFIDPSRKDGSITALKAGEEATRKTSAQEKLELLSTSNCRENAIVHAALTQASGRVCVTAPSGDRSQSYIHLRRPAANNNNLKQKLRKLHTAEQEVSLIHPEDSLLLAVSEELQDLELHSLERIEEDIIALDTSHTGTVHQSELTYLLLRWQVPLRLPTLASLMKVFSSPTHPEQVLYKELLQFIQKLIQNQELQNTEVDIWKASPELGHGSDVDSEWSGGLLMSADPGDAETWLQRFQKMESALRLCDSQNTGYIEKDHARRLIQNYSQIFDLNLSPLRINEVMRNAQQRGRVHLANALQLLKGR